MGLLADRFREEVNKSKDVRMAEAVPDVSYRTMFLPFDYLNGYVSKVDTPQGQIIYNSIGIVDGSSVTFIGRSGSGKTTIALQMAANIVRPFENGMIFYDDIEGGSNRARRENLTKFYGEEHDKRIIYRNAAVSAENFYKRIAMIYDIKIKNKADFEYDTGIKDNNGNNIFKMVPTVYILDSLAMLTPEKITDEEELSGQMSATAAARSNTAVFKRIIPKLKAANIILFVINHINDKVEINAFTHTKASIGFLKQGETLPGGKAAQFLANTMIRVDDGTKLKESEGLGIEGKNVDFELIKTRTNAGGRKVTMVFTFDHGFDEILSMFSFLKSVGAIITSGSTCYLRGFENIKFKQKNFKNLLAENEEFANAFSQVSKEELAKLLINKDESLSSISRYNSILGNIVE